MNDFVELQENQPEIKKERKLKFEEPNFWFFLRLFLIFALIGALIFFKGFFFEKKGDYDMINYVTGIVFAVLAVVFSFFRIEMKKKKNQLICSILHALMSATLSYYTMEMLGFTNIIKEEIQAVFINIALILFVYLFIFVITNRIKAALAIGTILVFAMAVTNHLVYLFRGTPFLPNDIYATGTAMNVISKMKYDPTYHTILGAGAFILNMIISCKVTYKDDSLRAHLWGKLAGGFTVALVAFAIFGTEILTNLGVTISYWNSVKTANYAGELMQIAVYINKSKVEKPEDYSVQTVNEIEKNYSGIVQEEGGIQPNLIVIMNEAFSDLSVIKEFETNEDYMPFFRSLKDNDHAITGYMLPSIKGGGTCNTEFEFLTGNTTAFLPAASIPYQQYIHTKSVSMAYILRDQGYTAIASHPYYPTGWRRSSVYPLLGFEDFKSLDDWPKNAEKGRMRLITDLADYKYLINQFEEKKEGEKLFLFNVTMQNHSGYSTDYAFPDRIKAKDYDYIEAEVYLSLMKQSDNAFKYLIEYFEKVEEPTMIVMFGDHQPGDMNEFLDDLSKDLSDTVEDTSKLYLVPYVIWTNYDLEKTVENSEIIGSSFLGSVVMDLANIDLPGYNQYLLELRKKYPVITSRITITPEGKYVNTSREIKRSEEVREYQMLEYNNMFDISSRNGEFFFGKKKE